VVTGHSLGGGVAGLLAIHWHQDPDFLKLGLDMKVYPLAPPLVCSEEFNPCIDPYTTSICNGHDMVPRLSYSGLRDLVNVVKFLGSNSPISPHEIIKEGRL
jgi:hypothetical protein